MDLINVHQAFQTQEQCIDYLESLRWPNGVICPDCQTKNNRPIPKKNRHHCRACNSSFSVFKYTIFEHTKIPLIKWFAAFCLLLNAKKGISARQLGRNIQVDKNSAWSMSTKIRVAMSDSLLYNLQLAMEKAGVLTEVQNNSSGQEILTGRNLELYRYAFVKTEDLSKIIFGKSSQNFEINKAIKPHLKRIKWNSNMHVNRIDDWQLKTLKTPAKRKKGEYIIFNYRMNNQFGFWHMFKRALYGQYHRISPNYAQLYINELIFKQEKIGTFSGLIRQAIC